MSWQDDQYKLGTLIATLFDVGLIDRERAEEELVYYKVLKHEEEE